MLSTPDFSARQAAIKNGQAGYRMAPLASRNRKIFWFMPNGTGKMPNMAPIGEYRNTGMAKISATINRLRMSIAISSIDMPGACPMSCIMSCCIACAAWSPCLCGGDGFPVAGIGMAA